MNERFVRIVGFGLIGVDKDNGPYRQVIFKDDLTGETAEMLVNKKERPMLWEDIEKLERGKSLPPYRGSVMRFQEINLLVFENEKLEEVLQRQREKLHVKAKIYYAQAESIRQETKGYITNLTTSGAMEISWKEIDLAAKLVKFRQYAGKGKFVWGSWYEIVL